MVTARASWRWSESAMLRPDPRAARCRFVKKPDTATVLSILALIIAIVALLGVIAR
jgi:hypothetical protein